MKIISNNIWMTLSASKIRTDIANHLRLIPRSAAAMSIALYILVQQFIRVELWAVTGKTEYFNTVSFVIQPRPYCPGSMYRMPIQYQKYFSFVLLYKSFQEIHEYLYSEGLDEYHETQMTTVRYSRNHIASETIARTWNHGGTSTYPIGTACYMIGSESHFIAPVYDCTFSLCTPLDFRINLIKPPLYSYRILLKGSSDGLLRGKSPGSEVIAYGRDCYFYSISIPDQVLHCFPCPQNKRKLQLIGAFVYHKTGYCCCLLGSQSGPQTLRSSPLPGRKCFFSTFPVCSQPFDNCVSAHAEEFGHLCLGFSGEYSIDRLAPQVFLSNGRQRPCILNFHDINITYEMLNVNYFVV